MFVIPPIGKVIERAALWTHIVTTAVVFIVLFMFALISYQNAQRTLEFQQNQVLDQKLSQVRNSIIERMDENSNMAQAGVALFDGSEAVTADEWHRFFEKFQIESRYDGITSIGYAPIVSANDQAVFLQTLQAQGVTAPSITPTSQGAVTAPVLYVETYKGTKGAFGYDLYTSPERKAAMDRAATTGQVALTQSLLLANSQKLGAVIYAPVYVRNAPLSTVEQRQAATRGYAFVGVRIEQLLANVLPASDRAHFGIVISEESKNALPKKIYSSIDTSKTLQRTKSSTINLYGNQWRVALYADDAIVSQTETDRPSTILAAGIIISVIASAAVYLLIKYRTRSFAITEEKKLQLAKDELLSLASHQLRTPATGVKQYIAMVVDGFAGDITTDQRALLDQAYKSNERQLRIINEFLYVAKLGSNSLTTAVHTFDLVPLVHDVVKEMQPDILEKQHSVKVRIGKTLKIDADEHSVRMIIENLVSNAVKYTKPKGVITVHMRQVGHEVLLTVKDTGIGIAKKDMDMLFKQFSRIPNELSGEVNGSGIGLYLAQQLAQRNNGVIEVTSNRGKGTTFTLRLQQKSVKKFTS